MRIHEHHKSSLFIIEMIFSIFILAFSAAACTHVFAIAQNLRTEARESNDCQILFTNICEQLSASAENVEPVTYYDAELNPTENDLLYCYKSSIKIKQEDHVAYAEIEISKIKKAEEKQLLQEQLSFFSPNTV